MQLPIYWEIQISNLGTASGKSLSHNNRKSVSAAKGTVVKDMNWADDSNPPAIHFLFPYNERNALLNHYEPPQYCAQCCSLWRGESHSPSLLSANTPTAVAELWTVTADHQLDLRLYRTQHRPKLASSASPQKLPITYTRVNDFRPHMDSLFRRATYTRERIIREYIWYFLSLVPFMSLTTIPLAAPIDFRLSWEKLFPNDVPKLPDFPNRWQAVSLSACMETGSRIDWYHCYAWWWYIPCPGQWCHYCHHETSSCCLRCISPTLR